VGSTQRKNESKNKLHERLQKKNRRIKKRSNQKKIFPLADMNLPLQPLIKKNQAKKDRDPKKKNPRGIHADSTQNVKKKTTGTLQPSIRNGIAANSACLQRKVLQTCRVGTNCANRRPILKESLSNSKKKKSRGKKPSPPAMTPSSRLMTCEARWRHVPKQEHLKENSTA